MGWGRLWSEFARRSASRRRVKDEGRGGGRRSPEKLGAQSEDGEWAEGRASLRFPSPVLALAWQDPGALGIWATVCAVQTDGGPCVCVCQCACVRACLGACVHAGVRASVRASATVRACDCHGKLQVQTWKDWRCRSGTGPGLPVGLPMPVLPGDGRYSPRLDSSARRRTAAKNLNLTWQPKRLRCVTALWSHRHPNLNHLSGVMMRRGRLGPCQCLLGS